GTPATATTRPPRWGPMLRHSRPRSRSRSTASPGGTGGAARLFFSGVAAAMDSAAASRAAARRANLVVMNQSSLIGAGGDFITPHPVRSSSRGRGRLAQGGAEGGGHLGGGGLAAEVRRARASLAEDALDGRHHAVVRFSLAELVEQHCARPHRAYGVGDALARDVGRLAVDGLEHRGEAALRVDVGARG